MNIPERDWMWPGERAEPYHEGFWETRIWHGPISFYAGESVRISNRGCSAAAARQGREAPWEKVLSAVLAGRAGDE